MKRNLLKKKEFYIAMTGMTLLAAAMGFVVLSKGGNTDHYLALFLPILALEAIAILFSLFHGAGLKFPVICGILLNTGIGMQCMIQKENASYGRKEQIILLMALLAAAGMVFLHKKILTKIKPEIFLILIALLTAGIYVVLLAVGTSIEGTKAWLNLGPLSLQPTELIKLLFVYFNTLIFCCMGLSDKKKLLFGGAYFMENLVFSVLIRELGSLALMMILFAIYCILFLESVRTLLFLGGAGGGLVALAGGGIFFLNKMGRGNGLLIKVQNRFTGWLHPELDPLNTGFQAMQAREAMSLGGWFGSDMSVTIPVEESDFIFVSMILHLGVVAAVLILLLFLALLVEGIRIYLDQEDPMTIGILAGCTYYIFAESIFMILGSTGFFMMTGVPIAFISDGGTALMTVFMMTALILYLGRRKPEQRKERRKNEKINKCVIREN